MGRLCFVGMIAVLLSLFTKESAAQIISLDGDWQFAVDTSGHYSSSDLRKYAQWRTVRVPLSWQAQCADLRDYQGVAWYKKTITLPRIDPSRAVLLHFGAVDYIAEVFVNGHSAGKHEGGYLPFDVDIRRYVRKGANEVVVRVMDPVSTGKGTEGINYLNIPHGKQSWYVQTSGLWQSVDISIRPQHYIRQVRLTPDVTGGLQADVRMGGQAGTRQREGLRLRLFDPKENCVIDTTVPINPSSEQTSIRVWVNGPQLWSFDSPALYRAQLSLGRNDIIEERFGFRSIEARNRRLLLNGRPFFLIGALDQDFYPENIYSTPSEEVLRDEMLKAKRIGLNTLRCHIKIPDPRYLRIADEVGLLVWQEIPNWDVFTPEVGKRAMETLTGMLERDWNHPSLAIISLINESWGLDLRKSDQRLWLKSAFDEAKRMALGRLVVDNSACWGNFHMKTDINDYHTYWSIPEHRGRFDQTIAEFAGRPDWLFSSFGDAEQTKQEPLVLSEFGNWGLPKLPDPPPWWISRRFGKAEVVLPQDYEIRFRQYRYNETFGNYDRLAEASQRNQFLALKHEIEELRKTPGIEGYVITEFTDINWESNGLLDMWRNVKVYGADLNDIQQQDVSIPYPERYNYWSGDSASIRVWCSHYSRLEFRDAVLSWSLNEGARGSVALPPVSDASLAEVASLRIPLKIVQSPERLRLDISLITHDGRSLAKNHCDLYVYPRTDKGLALTAEVYDPGERLGNCRRLLSGNGQREKGGSTKGGLVVTSVIDSLVMSRLDKGAAVLCLADSETRLPAGFPFRFVSRNSPWYDGNWASSLNWVRSEKAPFREINLGNTMGFEASSLAPIMVIDGIPESHYSDVLAGMFVGWIHLNSAYIVQMRRGSGTIVLCTLPLAENAGKDPYASTLFLELVNYLAGKECAPLLRWSDK